MLAHALKVKNFLKNQLNGSKDNESKTNSNETFEWRKREW